jgi:ATP-dependent RNA helicase DDX55/SPB4
VRPPLAHYCACALTRHRLQNNYVLVPASAKLLQLTRILAHEARTGASRAIIYFSTCAAVDHFFHALPLLLPASTVLHSLHGHLAPAARTRALAAFAGAGKAGETHVLLATDVAARGLDLPRVDAVLQFEPPTDPRAFAHRVGRTARAGAAGRAWVLLGPREAGYVGACLLGGCMRAGG